MKQRFQKLYSFSLLAVLFSLLPVVDLLAANPTTPSSPNPSNGATNVAVSGTFSWSTSPNDGGSSVSYDLYMGTTTSNMTLYKSGSGKSCSYSGLKAGQKYYWKVVVYNRSGGSTQGAKWYFTTKAAAAPTTPTSPSPSSGATNVAVSGTLSWSTSPNDGGSSISYDLYMGTSSSNMSLYKSGSGKSCSYSGLKTGQKYFWKVIVYNGSGKSTQSSTWNFTTKDTPAPTTPSSPSPSSGSTNVAVSGTLSWSTSPNDGGSSISYDLYLGTSSGSMSLYKSGSGKSCSYSGLKNGQKYYWKVIVYNGSGKSTQSSTWNFTTKDTPAPTTPSSPSPSSGATNVAVSGTLSWSTSPNDGGSSISYDLYMGTSSGSMSLYRSGSGKSCSYSGLNAGQKYYWKVIVYNGSGKSTQSSTWSFTTKATPAPTTPSSPTPSDGATNVAVSGTLKWSCSANDGGSTLSYDLYMGTSSGSMTLYKSGSGTSCAYSGLSAGKKYYWKLIAYNGSGKSTQGPVWSFTTKEVAAPSTPSSPSPSNGATNVAVSGTLSWSCSPNDGGSTLSYDLYMGTSSSNMTLYKSGQGTSCAYSGLSNGKTYYWKLIAYNGSGKSTQSPTWSFTTKDAPTVSAPTTPSSPSPSNGATNVAVSGTLSWSCSPNDGGSTLSYDLYMGTSSSNMTLYKSGQGTSCAYSGLSNGKTYYWKLIAYNGSGKSTQSPTWSFTTKDAPTVSAPTTPSSPSPSNGATNVAVSGTLSWSCSPNDGGSTLSYDLYMGTSSSNMTLYKSGQGTSCAYSELSNGKTYYWKLIAYNGSGKSTQSPTWSFTTKAATVNAPTTPSSPSPSNGAMNVGTSGTLKWSCSPNDGGSTLSYDLYMGTSSSNMTLYKSGQGTSCAYSGLSNGKTYYWKLIAYNGSGKSTQSPTWSFTTTNSSTVSAPTTPSSPSPSNGATNVAVSGTLSWSCSPNDGGSTLSYDLYMGTSSSNMTLYKSGQGTSCTYSGLSNGKTYYWKLIAYNGSGKSTQSPTWSFTTTNSSTVSAPTTPSSPSPSNGAMNVGTSGTLKWSCSPNDGGSTLSYDLYMGTSSSNMTLYKSGQGTSCAYSGLSNGKTYYWKLIAYNGSGKSTQSPTWSFTTTNSSTVSAPTTPSSPSPSNGAMNVGTSGTLKWSCSPNDGGSTLSYDLYMGTSSSNMTLYKSGQGTSCAYSGLSNGKTYYWKLIAYNGSGKSTQSPTWSFTTTNSSTVSAPTTPSSPSPSNGAMNVGTSGTLKWSCSPNDGGSTLSYDLYIGTSTNNMVLYKSGQGTSCSYSLAANTTYYWKLIAYNGSGKSTQSPTWSFTTKAATVNAPTTPSSPSPSSGAMNVGTSGTLKWNCSPNDGGSTLSYDLYIGTSVNNMTLYKSGQGTSCNYSLASNTTYYWKLIAYNGSGKSTQSPTWSFTTGRASTTTTLPAPNPSTFNATNITETGFTASWGAVSGAKYYDIKVKSEGGTYDQPVFSQATASTTINVTGLNPGTSYKFRLRARNGNHNENSDWSGDIPSSVKTKSQGTAPANLTIYKNSGIDGSKSLIAGKTYHYSVLVLNSGSSTWKGAFYLKDGNNLLKPWYNISLPKGVAQPLEFDYTPQNTGNKVLTLYYQTNTSGDGIPVKPGNSTNPMTVKVVADPSVYNGLKLEAAITSPTTLELGKQATILAKVTNSGSQNWEGKLYLTDNGSVISEQENLESGKSKTLYYGAWKPLTTGTHNIAVYYQSKEGSSQQLVNANGFKNPVTVVVSNADVLGDASKVVIKHITASVEPKEVTPGSVVMYHYKLLDENGKQLRNMKLRFKYDHNNMTKYIDSEPSDLEGYAVLYLATSGTNAIAGRGQTVNLECMQAINENNKTIPISASDSEKKISLKIHQGTSFSRANGFENVEKVKLTISPGVSFKIDKSISSIDFLGQKAKAKVSLGFPIGISLKWDDYGYVSECAADIGVKFSASGSTSKDKEHMTRLDKYIPSVKGKIGTGYRISFTTDPKEVIIKFVMGWIDNYTEGTDWKTDLAVKAMRKWFEDRNNIRVDQSFYYSFGADISGDIFSVWPGSDEIKEAIKPALSIKDLSLSGNGNITIEPWKTKGDNLRGYSTAVKLGGAFEFKGKVHNLIDLARTRMRGEPITEAYYDREIFNDKFFYGSASIKYSSDFSMKHDEMYNKSDRSIEQVSQQMALSSSWDFSLENLQIGDFLTDGWFPLDFSLGYTNKYTQKVSSKGDWTRFLHRQVISENQYMNDVLQVFPNLSYKTYFAPPLNIYNTWQKDFDIPLARLASITPNPNSYELKDALKFERTVSSEFDASLSLRIYDWGWAKFYIDTDVNLELENKPNESYFSIPDRRTFDVVLRPTTTIKETAKNSIKYAGDLIFQTFEEEHPYILKAWEWMKQTYNMVVDEFGNVVQMVDNAIGDEAEHAFYLFWYHWYMHDRYNANAKHAMRKHPLLAEKEQTDICKFALGINKEERNFNPGVKIEVPHYYPAGDLLGITEQGDTLFVVSEVIDIIATQGVDTLRTTQAGQFQMETTIGVDDLTPFGFPEDTPLGLYHAEEGSKIWSYVGPAGSTIMTDKLGAYMIATSIKNDVITPEILADYDKTYGVIHLNIKDNIGVRIGSLSITINGEEKEFSMISESSIDVYLTDEEMQHMLTLYVTINDLAGNQGTLFQMYNLDMPTTIEDVKTEDDKTSVQFKDHQLKVEGAKANATICVFSIDGSLVVKAKADEQGRATVQLSSVPDGLYVFTISNGKSGKILVKKVG